LSTYLSPRVGISRIDRTTFGFAYANEPHKTTVMQTKVTSPLYTAVHSDYNVIYWAFPLISALSLLHSG